MSELSKLLQRFPDKSWNWIRLSANPNITMKDVLAYPDKPWSWAWLSTNSSITMRDVLANPDKPWSWLQLSKNPNITMRDVLAYPDKPWNWGWLSGNKFLYHPSLQSAAIKKLIIVRVNRRRKIHSKILRSSALYSDLISVIVSYHGD